MGVGGGTIANFANTGRQTDIGVASSPYLPFWKDCVGQPIAAVETPPPGTGVTAERSSLQQYDDLLTSYGGAITGGSPQHLSTRLAQ